MANPIKHRTIQLNPIPPYNHGKSHGNPMQKKTNTTSIPTCQELSCLRGAMICQSASDFLSFSVAQVAPSSWLSGNLRGKAGENPWKTHHGKTPENWGTVGTWRVFMGFLGFKLRDVGGKHGSLGALWGNILEKKLG